MAVGDAAGHVNPTTGGGIAGAAYAGKYAGEQAVKAISDGDVSEENLWRYNTRVMDHFGGRYAGLDVYNVLSTAVDVDNLMGLLASLPGEKLAEALYEGSTSMSFGLKVKAAVKSFGYWGTIRNFYQTKSLADELIGHYDEYPTSPAAMANWTRERDDIMDRVYETTGADAKY
jgi:flavin-dependent dehydrogenase